MFFTDISLFWSATTLKVADLIVSVMQHQREPDNMPRHGSCQSGPDDSDASQSVDYEEGEALKEIDAEDGDCWK